MYQNVQITSIIQRLVKMFLFFLDFCNKNQIFLNVLNQYLESFGTFKTFCHSI